MINNSETLPPELASINQLEPREALEVLLKYAAQRKASDLFFQPSDSYYTISTRQLGSIRRVVMVSKELGSQLVNLVKSSAGMELSEHRHPLDGRWAYQIDGKPFEFRINSMGTLFGEDLVLRLLPTGEECLPLEKLGLVGNQFSDLRTMLASRSGLLLVTGPVGAGKSTTLYACLDYLNDGSRMIITLEDPVERVIKGIRQSQVQPKIGLGFLELLRGVLRQSPDIIMIGEIRDEETAQTAVRAASSGHLVLATLHSPLAVGAIQSMLAFGVNPFFLSNSLVGVIAQRLIRTLSPTTRKMYDVSHSPETFKDVREYLEMGQGNVIYGPDENDPDSEGGYVALTGLFEVLTINRTIQNLIAENATEADLHRAGLNRGMLDFSRAALLKTAQGITGVEEISLVVPTMELEDHERLA